MDTPASYSFLVVLLLFESASALARPEYAAKEKLNCVSCHALAWGGGPRNIVGKTYGAHGHTPAKTSTSELYYADVRFIDYYSTESTSKRSNGAALMQASVTGNAPITQSESGTEMRGVLTLNAPTLGSPGPREAYLRWQLGAAPGKTPTQIYVGRFYAPFGQLTDEHRTYTRIQTNMSINNFDIGAALSTNPTEALHFDLALVNDFQTGGAFNIGEVPWGVIANARWNSPAIPLLFGMSGNYERMLQLPDPIAGSAYAALSLDRLTNSKLSGSLLLEGVIADNWNHPTINTGLANPSLSQFFIPQENATYLTSVQEATSLGVSGQAKYNLTNVWTLLYRFDYLALDVNSLGTNYTRHGVGFEAYLNSNLIWQVRYEAAAHPSAISAASNTTLAIQDDIFMMLRAWL